MFFFAWACTTPEIPESVESSIWSGFHYEWAELSHRISLIEANLHEDASITMGMIGGDWSTGELFSDLPQFRMHQQRVSSPYFRATHGTSTLELYADEENTLEIDLPDNSRGYILRGFSINTDVPQDETYPSDYNPAHGYTASSFHIHTRFDRETQTAVIQAKVDWGPQDREKMNAAMEQATSSVIVYWSAIENDVDPIMYDIESHAEHDHEPPFSEHDIMQEHLELAQKSVVGITSFSLSLNDKDGSDMGSYWRRMGVELICESDTSCFVNLDASNSSLIEELAVDAYGTVSLAAFPLTEDSIITSFMSNHQHEVGIHSYEAP